MTHFLAFIMLKYCITNFKDGNILRVTTIIALIFVALGAFNLLLIGVFSYDMLKSIFGPIGGTSSRILYTIIGISGVWVLFTVLPIFVNKRKYAKNSCMSLE